MARSYLGRVVAVAAPLDSQAMSGFTVQTASITDAAGNVDAGTDGVIALLGPTAGLSGAADGTPAAADFEDYLSQWTAILPQIAQSNDSIATALSAAGAAYEQVDAAVAGPGGGSGS